MPVEHLDVLIVGAGLSGIGAACHLTKHCPGKRFALLEGRAAMGGTWDLFRYPGIRSDSDMFTLGYNFKPWSDPKAIADGPSIRRYIEDTARENGIDRKIRYRHRLLKADWDSATARWNLDVQRDDEPEPLRMTAQFLLMCTGYYRYEAGYTPEFAGREDFAGRIVHPQLWPEDLDYSGKKVVVIGSGATAVTLVPSMTDKAAHVTMLQRSPSYVITLPQKDAISNFLRRFLPETWVYRQARARNVAMQMIFFMLAKGFPGVVRKALLKLASLQLGKQFDMRHFSPRYKPWDERVCAVPDGDLFKVLRKGKASVVTEHIDRFVDRGIRLKTGEVLEADIIVTATGLDLVMFGGAEIAVDGKPFQVNQSMGYRGIMLRDLPNLAAVLGYTNASWTLKADLSSEYFCRLINHMDAIGMRQVTARDTSGDVREEPFLNLNSGYIQRAADRMPKQGDRMPWKLYQNYVLDLALLRYGKVEDGYLVFSSPASQRQGDGAAVQALG
ncbi:NAD(P)/FAD-dependent oxidoreductase [Pseudomonas paraeruginosa]|uniref:flavin-containing monooxygenase n=1 Tax=Pseudomonas aeruginosa group TaxID=136841 RepID=UPI00053D125D|nr:MULTISPECIES: NAD(P)/FAD-dependent oxidoreductase [Pseudomonas aeruginosa group]VTS64490.1 FAD-containing monooxygenase EthA [Streptococcus dysgalactiae subsp. equisimilis]KAB0742567.1 NAD(P)/FAD-dependent oxidoreductase [Pseudomonas aeruginosa]KRU88158.1 FAD-containing monooxygenase EthA [Pseudomonas aeruginosa]KSP94092.1 FAD-containing monooxygenase EthA [Pseudomonas aeruginosa]KSR45947.1 FAD-containing monooxygenase EthA [Pseudomonas aeruginosa]